MSYFVSPNETYIRTRINEWFITVNDNMIHGMMKPFGAFSEAYKSGYIVSYMDNYVIAKIDCKLYALILGNIRSDKKIYQNEYITYIKTKVSTPAIII